MQKVLSRTLKFLLIFAIGLLCAVSFFGWKKLYVNLLEGEPPVITVKDMPKGMGVQPMTFHIDVEDEDSGLDEVIVRRKQGEELKEITRKRYSEGRVHHDSIPIKFSGKEAKLAEGAVEILVTAFDNSYWSNKQVLSFQLKVDYKPPQVEVLTTQHNAVMGGCELVFYKVVDKDETFSAVTVGSHFFRGFQAKTLDKDFSATPDLYFAFFAVPLDFDSEKDEIRVMARDDVGNVTTAPVYYHLGDFQRAKRERVLSPEFMDQVVEPLYKRYQEKLAKINSRPVNYFGPAATPEGQIERFRAVNGDFRTAIDHDLESGIFLSPKPQRYWDGKFIWVSGLQKTFYGEEQRFTYQGSDAGTYISQGVDLATPASTIVRAANRGTVIWADDLGVYGKTVILDHGFGLTTVYSNLDSYSRSEGDVLEKGDELGLTGKSGLSYAAARGESGSGEYLHFETRLYGIPVRPAEWWDARWIHDHIEQKIADMKKVLWTSGYRYLCSRRWESWF